MRYVDKTDVIAVTVVTFVMGVRDETNMINETAVAVETVVMDVIDETDETDVTDT